MTSDQFIELPLISSGPITHSPKGQDPIIGIDLGTTNSLVAIVDRSNNAHSSEPIIITSREGKKLVPSVVHFTSDGNLEIGYAAKRHRLLDHEHTIYSVKRLLGRGVDDIKEILKHLPYDIEGSSASNVKIKVGERSYTPIEISAMILAELKSAAEEHLGRSVEDAVITVPAYFNDSQRQATRAAGRIAGLNVLRILNEPTAASLAYGIAKKKNGLIAVYDLGGGTFDISILRLRDGIFEVLSTNGDTALGGDDIDQAIAAHLAKSLPGLNYESREVRAHLIEVAEKLKIQLSNSDVAVNSIEFSGTKHEVRLTRLELESLVLPIIERTKGPVEQAIADAGITRVQLTDVVLVGGPTRLSVIQRYVEGLFGRTPNSSLNPDEIVALGAAVQADILAGNNRDLLLLDVVPLSLGIETFGGTMSKLIQRNTRIPTLAKEQFTTYIDGQTKVAINVYQGERELVAHNRRLSEFVLHGIPPLPAGVARVEVTFLVDADGILNVTAKETYSGVEASIEVRPTYGLTDAEVEKMLAEGLAYSSSDRDTAKFIEAKNDASTVLLATEKALQKMRPNMKTDDVQAIETLIANLKTAMSGSNLLELKNAQDALSKGTVGLAESLMAFTMEHGLKNKHVNQVIKK